jgi:hypothetical protein
MTVVLATVVTAIGAIIVALVSAIASRLETRDTRARLLKDLEIWSKLKASSGAHSEMDGYIAGAVRVLVYRETRLREYLLPVRFMYIALLAMCAAFGVSLVAFPKKHVDYHPLEQGLYTGLLLGGAVLFVASSIVFIRSSVKFMGRTWPSWRRSKLQRELEDTGEGPGATRVSTTKLELPGP